MATRFFSLSRIVSTNKSLTSLLTRSYTVFSPSLSLSQFSPVRLRSLAAVSHLLHGVSPVTVSGFRVFSTRQTQSSMNDSNPNWSNRPPKETILLDGCDFEHWLVVVEKPDENATRDDIIASYIETLAKVVGSAEEARMKIYSVSTKHYFAFGALVSEELSYKLKELPNVRWVLPDSYLDVRNKDYGGEPFINGQAVPYDPKYHDEWVRNNAKAMERNRRNDRPRNFDRSRNFERRRQNVQDQGPPMPNSNQPPQSGQMPPNNMGGMPPNNMGGMPPNNMGGMPPNNMGGMPPNNRGGMAPNNMGGGMPNNHTGGMRPNSLGGAPNQGWQGQQGNAPNLQGGGPPPNFNYGGPNNNFRPPPSQGYPPNPQVGNQVQGQPPQGYPSQAQGPPPQGYPGQGQGYPSQGVNYGFNNGGPSRGNQYSGEDMPPMPPSPPRNY